jgi:GH18 family chitinase
MEQIEMLRSNQELYSIFMDLFVACMVGKDVYRRASTKQPLNNIVTVSDEAMAMLVLKNNYALWMEMSEKMEMGVKKVKLEDCRSKQLYFDERKGRGRSWSDEGKIYFNETYKAIVSDRLQYGDNFDKEYLQNMKMKNKPVSINNNKTSKAKIECMTDFSIGGMFSNTIVEDQNNVVMQNHDSKAVSSNVVSI